MQYKLLFLLISLFICLVSYAGNSSQEFLKLKQNNPQGVDALYSLISGVKTKQIYHQGCCSWHQGVCGCKGGRTVCCDGILSPTCGC